MKLRELGLADAMTIKEADILHSPEFANQKVMEADIVLFQRPATEEWLKFVKVAQKAGKIIVVDYDDDPFNTNPLSPAYRFYGTEDVAMKWEDGKTDMLWQDGIDGFNIEQNIRHRDLFRANFKKADMITCTTDILGDSFRKINPNTVVLPNLVDFSLYPKVEYVKKGVRILWQGGSSHYEDLYMVKDALVRILKKYPDVVFVYFGDMRFKNLFKDAPQSQIEWHSWVSHQVYPYKLATLNCDIGLCPVTDNIFNRNKSAIKWMEYSLMGMATIASNIPPYSTVIEGGRAGILVNDDLWFDAMEQLIKDKAHRESIAYYAREEVHANHNADTKAFLWKNAYERLLKAELVEA
jgi:glycosyltransferase involved in cell wall biosynthesis